MRVLNALSGTQLCGMEGTLTQSAITSESINPPKLDLTDEPLVSPFEGEEDVVWWCQSYGPLRKAMALWEEAKTWTLLSVFMTADDAVAYNRASCPDASIVVPQSLTLDQAKQHARAIGRVAVVLRDRTGNEIERYPV